jgi:hypothetical protein
MQTTILDKLFKFLSTIRHDPTRLPQMDSTQPNYNFISYLECCNSLNRVATVTKFVRYNQYWKDYFKEKL